MKNAKKKWNYEYIYVCLNYKIYPNKIIPKNYFILTKKELDELIKNTKIRASKYVGIPLKIENVKPKK